MADFDPPSFSLGLDFDADPPELRVADSEEEDELWAHPDPPKRVLKRLRRGHVDGRRDEGAASGCGGDDDIEEFSSQEDLIIDACPSRYFNSVSSSSKAPLRGSGVFSAPSSSNSKGKRKEPASDAPASSALEAGHKGLMFPKLTLSPLRRFQLIDSDSDSDGDEPPKGEGVKCKNHASVASSMTNSSTSSEQARMTKMDKQQSEDLWKDFHPMKSSRVATPVLDEVCDEYFRSLQNRNITQKQGNDFRETGNRGCQPMENSKTGFDETCIVGEHLAPAHLYFFNEDPRIRSLVRGRLPNFFPLPMSNSTGDHQPNESAIDYIAQFNGKASRPCGPKSSNGSKASTRGGRKPVKTAAVQETSQGWVDPKSSSSKPKNVGNRRVHAGSEAAAGHWYTNQEGRKVYVSKGGEELSGQGAYRCYRKESGGSRRSKKKTSTQRKKG